MEDNQQDSTTRIEILNTKNQESPHRIESQNNENRNTKHFKTKKKKKREITQLDKMNIGFIQKIMKQDWKKVKV